MHPRQCVALLHNTQRTMNTDIGSPELLYSNFTRTLWPAKCPKFQWEMYIWYPPRRNTLRNVTWRNRGARQHGGRDKVREILVHFWTGISWLHRRHFNKAEVRCKRSIRNEINLTMAQKRPAKAYREREQWGCRADRALATAYVRFVYRSMTAWR